MKVLKTYGVSGSLLLIAFCIGFLAGQGAPLAAQAKNRVFELRIVTMENKAKLTEVLRRYREGQVKLWEKHGMKPIGFWVPTELPRSENTVIFIHSHASRQAADESRAKFNEDPEWKAFPKPVDLGQVKIESFFMAPADFSPIQ